MTIFQVPTSVVNPTSGDVVYLPGHASYADDDVSDALLYWLTTNNGGIGGDGFCGMSGHTVQFREESYPLEYGTVWGLAQNQSSYTDRSGYVWPQVKQHAWRDLTIDMNGAEWVQADNTTYDDGLVDRTGNTVAGDGTTITLDTPLTASQITRLRAATGPVPAISGFRSNGTNQLFTRKSGTGGVSTRAQIATCADDGTTVTLAAGNTCNETLADASVTVYLGAREGRRNDRLWMFAVGCPGAKGGVERSWMNENITIGGGTIRMGNTAGATSVFTAREQWHCYRIRAVDGLTIDSTMRGEFIWGDVINTGSAGQIGGLKDVALHAENVTVDGIYDTCGRHAITGQGHIGLTVRGVFRDIGRLFWDSETTSSGARVFDTTIEDVVCDPGTVFWHQSPATLSGEPPRTLSVTTVNGSNLITIPNDMLNSDDLGADITGAGIPAGAYLKRRMSPTSIELSANATASGTVTATIGSAVAFRGFTMRYVDNWSGAYNFAGNTACTPSRAYFTGVATSGSPTLTDVQFDTRIDGNSYTTADLTGNKVFSLAAGLFGAAANPVSVTSTTVTLASNAGFDSGDDRTVTCTTTAGDRTMTTTTAFFATSDKGRTVTGAGIRAGTTIVSVASAKNVELSLPAASTATGTVTVSGRVRFYAQLAPAVWDGYTIENCRNIGNGKWGGSSVVWQATHQPCFLMPARCDNVTVRRNFLTGARNNSNQVVERGFGYYDYPTFAYGADPAATVTFTQNRFVDMLDDQASTPTVTASVSLSGTNLTTARPTLTATVSFSDSRQERGGIVFYRNGSVQAGAAPIVSGTNTATFTPFTDSPTGIHLWTARWVGSWDTLSATSSSVTQNVGGVSPTTTTTTLTVSPTSPQDAGTSLTLSATVSPDPGNGSSVAFYDDLTHVGTGTTTSGVATLSTTLTAGTHPLVAQYAGSATYQASTGTSTFVSNTVATDTTPPTLDSHTPVAGAVEVATDAVVTMTFSESVSGLAFVLRDAAGQSVSGDLSGSGTSWTFTPTDDLLQGRTYTAVLDDCIDTATPANHLAGRVSWVFTTESDEYIPTGLLTVRR